MTKTAIRRELRNIRNEMDWLLWREQQHNPDWRFRSALYSKRRVRLVRPIGHCKHYKQIANCLYKNVVPAKRREPALSLSTRREGVVTMRIFLLDTPILTMNNEFGMLVL